MLLSAGTLTVASKIKRRRDRQLLEYQLGLGGMMCPPKPLNPTCCVLFPVLHWIKVHSGVILVLILPPFTQPRYCYSATITNLPHSSPLPQITAAQEPLLGVSPEPGVPGGSSINDDGGIDEADETEPLPGDAHYPWLERHMQDAYTRLVRITPGSP
jgi:hypothetical protein